MLTATQFVSILKRLSEQMVQCVQGFSQGKIAKLLARVTFLEQRKGLNALPKTSILRNRSTDSDRSVHHVMFLKLAPGQLLQLVRQALKNLAKPYTDACGQTRSLLSASELPLPLVAVSGVQNQLVFRTQRLPAYGIQWRDAVKTSFRAPLPLYSQMKWHAPASLGAHL
jgi:hypothetical protein